MAGEANELKGYIYEQLQKVQSASLVKTIAKFDYYNHVIPTVKQLNRALAGCALAVTRSGEDISLSESKKKLGLQTLSEGDLIFLYKAYTRPNRKKKQNA